MKNNEKLIAKFDSRDDAEEFASTLEEECFITKNGKLI